VFFLSEQPVGNAKKLASENLCVRITNIQDDGNRFLIHGSSDLYSRLSEVFDEIALGVSVTESEDSEASILYTENNRDVVLRILYDHTKDTSVDNLSKPESSK